MTQPVPNQAAQIEAKLAKAAQSNAAIFNDFVLKDERTGAPIVSCPMHEEWQKRLDNQAAVTFGQAETGRVITAAAAIMTLVFLSFALIPERGVKEFGLGLALAVLIDALIIRTILVPALMHMFAMITPEALRAPDVSLGDIARRERQPDLPVAAGPAGTP